MMCGKRRLLVVLAGLAAVVPAVMLWDATGRRVFTFFPSDDLAKLQQADGSLTGLFGGQKNTPIRNDFGLGLLPSGAGQGMISVLTFALPVGVVVLVSLLSGKHEVCEVS
ncbi:MAG: hypothetical protein WC718_04660 [Phycisphaerales bacterium]